MGIGLVFGVSRQTARERHKRESLKGEEEKEKVSNVSAGKAQTSRYELII